MIVGADALTSKPQDYKMTLPLVLKGWYPETAPAKTYMPVGSVARYYDSMMGFTGIVAGLQTLVINNLYYPQVMLDLFPQADFRLVQDYDYEHGYVLIGMVRTYDNGLLIFIIPSYVGPGCANKLVLWDNNGQQVIAEAWFDSSGLPPEPDPWPAPTETPTLGDPPMPTALPPSVNAALQDEVRYWVARAAEWEAR